MLNALFISHSHQDTDLIQQLYVFLRAGLYFEDRHIRCTSIASTGLAIGSEISTTLRRDIMECKYFMPVVTPNSLDSQFVAFEIGAAWALEKRVLPLILNVRSFDLPALLRDIAYCDLTDSSSVAKLGAELAQLLAMEGTRASSTRIQSYASRLASSAAA